MTTPNGASTPLASGQNKLARRTSRRRHVRFDLQADPVPEPQQPILGDSCEEPGKPSDGPVKIRSLESLLKLGPRTVTTPARSRKRLCDASMEVESIDKITVQMPRTFPIKEYTSTPGNTVLNSTDDNQPHPLPPSLYSELLNCQPFRLQYTLLNQIRVNPELFFSALLLT